MLNGSLGEASVILQEDLRFIIKTGITPLQQGDILEGCLRLYPPERVRITGLGRKLTAKIGFELANAIILTQTCNLRDRDIDLVTVAPILTFDEYFDQYLNKRAQLGKPPIDVKNLESHRLNKLSELIGNKKLIRYHHIKGCTIPGFINEDLIVDFGNIYGLDIGYVENMASFMPERLTLKDTFKLDLSHRLGEFFSRVDVPKDENDI